jgi:hypothetical protein
VPKEAIVHAQQGRSELRRPAGFVGLGVATVLAVGLSVPPAGAANNDGGLLAGPAANPQSTAFGGYTEKPAASLTAGAGFKVPALTCTTTLAGVAVGAFIFNSVNTKALTGASVWVTCQKGLAVYYGALEANGKKASTTFIPKAGDAIAVSVAQSTTGSKASLRDMTQAKSQSLSGTGTSNSVDLVGVDSILTTTSAQAPVPSFGAISYASATESGTTLAAGKAVAVDMANASKVVQILTGPLNVATGNRFTETFKHS